MDFPTYCMFLGIIVAFPVFSIGLELYYWFKGQSGDPRIGDYR